MEVLELQISPSRLQSFDKIKNVPLKFLLAYLIFSLILYGNGPFNWVTYHPVKFWTLNIVYLLALFLGWYRGVHTYSPRILWGGKDNVRIVRFLKPAMLVLLIYRFFSLFRSYHIKEFDPYALGQRIIWGISNMGQSYVELLLDGITDRSQLLGGLVFSVVSLWVHFWGFVVLLLGFYMYGKFSRSTKILFISNCLLIVIDYLGRGTNIGFFRIVLAVTLSMLFQNVKRRMEYSPKTNLSKTRLLICVLFSIMAVLFVFQNIMVSRGVQWDAADYNIDGITINAQSICFSLLPESLYVLLVSLSSYLTQGYYGMSLCMNLDWEPTFGLGNSAFLLKNVNNIFPELYPSTYQYRAEQMFGWHDNWHWHGFYTWLANDVSFYGVILIMLIIGYCFSLAYKDCIVYNNPFAFVVVYYFSLLSIFLPCNNQLAQSGEILFSFITSLLLWSFTRKKRIIMRIGDLIII